MTLPTGALDADRHPLAPIAAHLEALVDATADIDRWCSGPDWLISTHLGFAAGTPLVVLGYLDRWAAVLSRTVLDDGSVVMAGVEPLWGFACPLLLPDPRAQVGELVDQLRATASPGGDWRQLVLPGFYYASTLFREVAVGLSGLGSVYRAEGISRCTADLRGGVDAWLARRSARFRKGWRQTRRDAERHGITIVRAGPEGLMDRLQAIERRSWKGREGDGIVGPEMAVMYRELIARLAARGRLHAHIAVRGECDIGFILGGVRGGIYRGLQLAYAEEAADLGVGHLLQAHQLIHLPAEVTTYDLGMDMPYKRRYADEVIGTTVLVVRRSTIT